MKPAEYLDAAKARLVLSSDYELAKRAGIPRQSLPAIREGKRAVPLQFAYWLAITLELDPAQVVADLEAQREKNPARAEFWRSFRSHARCLAIAACMLASMLSAGFGSVPGGAGGPNKRRLGFA